MFPYDLSARPRNQATWLVSSAPALYCLIKIGPHNSPSEMGTTKADHRSFVIVLHHLIGLLHWPDKFALSNCVASSQMLGRDVTLLAWSSIF